MAEFLRQGRLELKNQRIEALVAEIEMAKQRAVHESDAHGPLTLATCGLQTREKMDSERTILDFNANDTWKLLKLERYNAWTVAVDICAQCKTNDVLSFAEGVLQWIGGPMVPQPRGGHRPVNLRIRVGEWINNELDVSINSNQPTSASSLIRIGVDKTKTILDSNANATWKLLKLERYNVWTVAVDICVQSKKMMF